MRVVSWLVVTTSVVALTWVGIYPLLGIFDLPRVEINQVTGTVGSGLAPASLEVSQARAVEPSCESRSERPADPDSAPPEFDSASALALQTIEISSPEKAEGNHCAAP